MRQWNIKHGIKVLEIPPDLPGEEWKPAVGYEDYYAVSNFGRVKRLKAGRNTIIGYMPTQRFDNRGYLRICLYCNGIRTIRKVHHLVLEAFIGPRPEGEQANHISGNKQDNYIGNLEYVTPSGNMQHSYDIGLRAPKYGNDSPHHTLTENDVLEIRQLLESGKLLQGEIASKYAISQSTISTIKHGITWGWLK